MQITEKDAKQVKGPACEYYIKLRLHDWGIWARKDDLHHLGYGKSNIAQIMASGGVFIENSQRSDTHVGNPEAEEIDRWVCELGSFRPYEALALCDFYIAGGGKKIIAKKRKITIRTLDYRLKYALLWLEGRLFQKNSGDHL